MTKKLFFYAIALFLCMESSSCTTLRIRTGAAQGNELGCKACEGNLNRWFWGYLYNSEYLVNSCESQALQAVQVKATFWQGTVTVLTIGIYCPVKVKWTCAKLE
jgi:hypothetical protein